MSAELTAAIELVVAHLAGERRADVETMGRALAAIGAARDFEVLGHAVYRALLAHNLARLRAARAERVERVAELETGLPVHPCEGRTVH